MFSGVVAGGPCSQYIRGAGEGEARCPYLACFGIVWPGSSPSVVCLQHAAHALVLADTMGFDLAIAPLALPFATDVALATRIVNEMLSTALTPDSLKIFTPVMFRWMVREDRTGSDVQH